MKKPSSKKDNRQLTVVLVICAIPVILALMLVLNNTRQSATVLVPTPTRQPTIASTQPAADAPMTSQTIASEVAARNGKYTAPPAMTIDTNKYYFATFKTAKGDIKVQLFANRTPITVNNFVFLARAGFYDNTTFHRVLEGFMAQGGDPTGTGGGGPGYTFDDEFGEGLVFDRPGLLAMANAGPSTNGSQFFITFTPQPSLTGRHTIFGEVVEGMDVLTKLTLRDPGQSPNFLGDTLSTVQIEELDRF